MGNKPALKSNIQDKLKEAVREKFQELLSEEEIEDFVIAVSGEVRTELREHIKVILHEELKDYVKKYISSKGDVIYDGNRPKFDQTITSAIQSAIPEIFEALLGNMIQSSLSNLRHNNGY